MGIKSNKQLCYSKSFIICLLSLEQMDDALQYMIGKLKHASLALAAQTHVKSVEAKSLNQKQKGGQYSCSYFSGNHKAVDCTKYKTINARND